MLPSQSKIALERFFDESGGTQLVIHAPYGSRINKAWGLALRKRFCRKFNFELQAAATEDAIILSLSTSHSFPLIEVMSYLHSSNAEQVLAQALLDAPLFPARFRWNATTALALPRFIGGRKVAPQLQRMKSEDLMATVFPDQVACLENIVGEREVPDHPLVAQTMHDCLREAMDVDGWLALLRRLESGDVEVVARDLAGPSPFTAEILSARPYAFLDDAPLEERRTRAVQSRGFGGVEQAGDLGRLDPGAVEAAREDAWPQAGSIDEMHEALLGAGVFMQGEVDASGWSGLLQALAQDRRATALQLEGGPSWVTAERLPQLQAVHPDAPMLPMIEVPASCAHAWTREDALRELVRARLGAMGPVPAAAIAEVLATPLADVEFALLALEQEGYVMRGRFSPGALQDEWCERHLLARIHRNTIGKLRREIEPVEARDYVRFLCDWQHVSPGTRGSGPDALASVLTQLEGFEAAAGSWESEVLPSRIKDYSIAWLDDLCTAGRIAWTRLRASGGESPGGTLVRSAPIVLLPRRELTRWTRLATGRRDDEAAVSSRAQKVATCLQERGAQFFDELMDAASLLHAELEDALAELVARGRVSCDSYSGLRALLVPASKRPSGFGRRGRRASLMGIADAGRWSATRRIDSDGKSDPEMLEHVARVLLRRYGVVCWRLLEREAPWLPPWRELLRVYQRLEARGELRGGRFIAGVVGQQFALPEAVASLRAVRKRAHDGAMIAISASDPLNLLGGIIAGEKVPRQPGARLLLRDGVPIASFVAGEMRALVELSPTDEQAARAILLRGLGLRSGADMSSGVASVPCSDPLGLHG